MSREKMFLAPGRPNSWSSEDQNAGYVRRAIAEVLAALASIPDDDLDTPLIDNVARARQALNDLDRHLPEVIAWCVVKHYSNSGDAARWLPAVWVGCKTEEQANAMRDAIAKHYDGQADRHGWLRDKWTVERRPCRISSVLRPEVTAEEYARGLGT